MRNAFSKTSLLAFAAALSSLTALAVPNPDQPVPERLDLKGAITFALQNNFDIRQAEERIKQQEGVLIEVRARNIPNADINYYYSKFDKQRLEPVQRSTDQDWAVDLQVSQNIFSGNAISSSIAGQKARREAAMLELRGVIDDALLSVREKFYGVLLTQRK